MAERNPDRVDLSQNQEGSPAANRIKIAGVLIASIGLAAIIGASYIYNPEATKTAIAAVSFGFSLIAIGAVTALRR